MSVNRSRVLQWSFTFSNNIVVEYDYRPRVILTKNTVSRVDIVRFECVSMPLHQLKRRREKLHMKVPFGILSFFL